MPGAPRSPPSALLLLLLPREGERERERERGRERGREGEREMEPENEHLMSDYI